MRSGRNVLEFYLGTVHSAAWRPTGFITSLALPRDSKVKEVEKRIRGLINELGQRLTPLDARWRDFSLNMPGAASVPAAPENVVAAPTLPG